MRISSLKILSDNKVKESEKKSERKVREKKSKRKEK
jgi:hypothetical protein